MRAKRDRDWTIEPDRLLSCVAGVDDPSRTAGTALHGSKVGLEAWRRAAALCASGSPRLRDVQKVCAVSYRTAWRMRQRLLDAAFALSERKPD